MIKFWLMFTLVQPNFFSKNHLLLGKTFLRENKKEEAKLWLEKAANSNPGITVDDEMVRTLLVLDEGRPFNTVKNSSAKTTNN